MPTFLGDYMGRYPKALSGGQRQRVAIGRAIVRDPKVFLFDEPLSNLDAALRVQTRMEIARLKQSLPSTTMIYVTHDQVEAMTLADRIVVLKDGEIQQVGSPMELYESPRNLFVVGFIGSPRMNFLSGAMAAAFGANILGVRAEHLRLSDGDGVWRGRVTYAENLGSDSYIYVDTGEESPIVVRQPGKATVKTGLEVALVPNPTQLHRFDEKGQPLTGGAVQFG